MFGLFCEFLFLIFDIFVYFISKKKKKKFGYCVIWDMLNGEGES
jgi:hypothetical protein